MKAITLTQPWASLIASGDKTIETRDWRPRISLPIPLAIHAARVIPDWAREWYESEAAVQTMLARAGYAGLTDLPLGAVVATCQLVGVVPTEQMDPRKLGKDRILGNFAPGRYAWVLRDVMPVRPPRPARGSQALWEWDAEGAGVEVLVTGSLL